jgi:hypothetical protein
MSILAHQSASSFSTRFLRRAWLCAGLFFFCGCAAQVPAGEVHSGIDGNFQLHEVRAAATAPASPGVSFYQRVLRSTLNSECTYFPSDSAYAQLMASHCGALKTTLKSFARFSLEPDAAQLGRPLVHVENRIHFENVPLDCQWLD